MVVFVRSGYYPNIWYCRRDPSGDFRTRLFETTAVDFPGGWDNDVCLVNLYSGEIRSFFDGMLHIDFLFDPLCSRGSSLYADFQRVATGLPFFKAVYRSPMGPAYTAMKAHTRTCPVCRAMLVVREVEPIRDEEEEEVDE